MVWLAAVGVAWGCSCGEGFTVDEAMAYASVVFEGRVVHRSCSATDLGRFCELTMVTSQWWKGEPSWMVTVRDAWGSSCGMGWGVGERHVAVAIHHDDLGLLLPGGCAVPVELRRAERSWRSGLELEALLGEPIQTYGLRIPGRW